MTAPVDESAVEPTATNTSAGPPDGAGPASGSHATRPSGEATAAPMAPTPAPAGGALSVAAVTGAWSPVLDTLSQRVRARFKGGRVLAVDGDTIAYGVPNTIARDRCAQVGSELESALTTHFGRPVRVEVVIDDQGAAPIDLARIEPRPVPNIPAADDEDDIGPVSELADATDQSANGIERLTRAFPGSEVIDG